jgi:hypothetical protein
MAIEYISVRELLGKTYPPIQSILGKGIIGKASVDPILDKSPKI